MRQPLRFAAEEEIKLCHREPQGVAASPNREKNATTGA